MYAIFDMSYLIATLVLVPETRKAWIWWAGWLRLGVLIGASGWIPTLLVGRQPYDAEAAWKVSEVAYPWHFYVVSKRANVLFFLFSIFTMLTAKSGSHLASPYCRPLAVWTGVALLWYVAAHLFPFVASPSLMRLHPVRGQDIWHLVAAINLWG